MRIGELAERTATSVRSLRYYEQQDLLLSQRTSGGHRVYDEDSVDRVRLIRLLLAAGVPTKAIVQIMPCVYSGTVTPTMLDRLLAERDRIAGQADELIATRDRLDAVIVGARARLSA